jgi:hypothetical protein
MMILITMFGLLFELVNGRTAAFTPTPNVQTRHSVDGSGLKTASLDGFADLTAYDVKHEAALLVLRRNAMMGLPCGSEKFVRKIEKQVGRNMHYKPQSRPMKAIANKRTTKNENKG